MSKIVQANLHPIFMDFGEVMLYIEEHSGDFANCFGVALEIRVRLLKPRQSLIELWKFRWSLF
jgi:hypothetical protein